MATSDTIFNFTTWLASRGVTSAVDGSIDDKDLTQAVFAKEYTAWLTQLANATEVREALGIAAGAVVKVELNQNDPTQPPSFFVDGTLVPNLADYFSEKLAVDVVTGKTVQERWYSNEFVLDTDKPFVISADDSTTGVVGVEGIDGDTGTTGGTGATGDTGLTGADGDGADAISTPRTAATRGADGENADLLRYEAETGLLPKEGELQIYLNKLLAQIVAQSGVQGYTGKVYVLTDPRSYDVAASAEGNIFIPIGFLSLVPNEDALAFVLAHEFAHHVYSHFSVDIVSRSQNGLPRLSLTNRSLILRLLQRPLG